MRRDKSGKQWREQLGSMPTLTVALLVCVLLVWERSFLFLKNEFWDLKFENNDLML